MTDDNAKPLGDTSDDVDDNAIAIIGMACRFPGAPDLASFWDLLASGREGLTRFDDAELASHGVPEDIRRHRNYVPVGAIIAGQEQFDPAHFGLTAHDAALLDPQLRLLLECAWDALGDAGHRAGGGLGEIGVFTGASHSDYRESNLAAYRQRAHQDPLGLLQADMGTLTDYFPQQISYRLNLTGPAVAVQATCATSLVAVHMAVQSLLHDECDAALAGGASLIVPQGRGYLHVPEAIFSADGHTRSFAADGTGMVHSQGAGIVVLRRLADALADGDPIYAVIRGTAVNHDGAGKAGFTAPSAAGQARVIAEALAVADVDADAVDLIEAHGTATVLGDQIELTALAAVFGERMVPNPIRVGSVKSNIGHTNSAAGIASLIKTALALHHRCIPATLHADAAHPELERHQGVFELPGHSREWPERNGTRIAGVSSFGIGGTNCHAVLEQAPAVIPGEATDLEAKLLLVSAASESSCRAQLDISVPDGTHADYTFTASSGSHAESGWRAAALLRAGGSAPRVITMREVPPERPRIVFAFPGAGAQYPGMGAGLYRDDPVFTSVIDECAEALEPLLDYDIHDIVTGRAAPGDVDDIRLGQPALFAVSLATATTMRARGVEPDAVLGHSLGEYAAAVIAGMLTLPDAARLVAVRSRALAATAPGGMLAVELGESETLRALATHPDLALAGVNAADSCVVSGPEPALDALVIRLTAMGIRTSRLRVAAALHSPSVAAAAAPLRVAAAEISIVPGTLPLYSTLTGRAMRTLDADHWARHLVEPVRFSAAISAATAEPATVIQVGPGSTLATLARRVPSASPVTALTTLPDAAESAAARDRGADEDRSTLLTALGELWCSGVDIDVEALYRRRRRVRLPVYAFDRRRTWIDPSAELGGARLTPPMGTSISDTSGAAPAVTQVLETAETRQEAVILDQTAATTAARSRGPAPDDSYTAAVQGNSVTAVPEATASDAAIAVEAAVGASTVSTRDPSADVQPPTTSQVAASTRPPRPEMGTGGVYSIAVQQQPPRTKTPESARLVEAHTSAAGSPAPAASSERLVAALWGELLGENVIASDADFFALGGTSMTATRMLERVNDQRGTDLRMRELLSHSTVSAFAGLLDSRLAASRPGAAMEVSGPDPVVPAAATPAVSATVAPGSGTPATGVVGAASPRHPGMLVAGFHTDSAATTVTDSGPDRTGITSRGQHHAARLGNAGSKADSATFPLTRVQHAYLVGRSGAFGLSDVACHIYLEYDCTDLDPDRYERAWNAVIGRHDMLRAVITEDGRNQVLAQVPDYRIRRHDLAAMPVDQREETLAELRRRLSHRVHRPDRWPLFDVRAAKLDVHTTRLFVGIDALICDAGSFLILDRDLRDHYLNPAAEKAPARTRFADYVAHVGSRADSVESARALDYWQHRLPELPAPPHLPTRTRTQMQPWFARRADRLAPADWQALRQLAAAHGVTPSAVLLTAYSDVLAAWSGDDRFTLSLTLVDRPAVLPGIEDVVGDFTTLLAHEVDRTAGGSFAERVARTQQRLFDDIDHREYSALDVLADLSSRTGQRQLLPVVFTSALDVAELVGGEPDLEWAGRITHGVSQTPQVWLDHQAFVQAGGLQVQWDVLETVLEPQPADTAFTAYVSWLRRLAGEPDAWTAPEAGPRLGAADDISVVVTEIWERVLSLESGVVQPDSTFIGLGGDSVLAVRMATLVRGRFGVAVPVVDLVGDITVTDLIALITERRSESALPAIELARQADPDAPFPLTPLQQAYWVGQQHGYALSYDSAHNYVDFRLRGIDPDAVEQAVRRQVERQPMLRAFFLPDGTQQVLAAADPRLTALPIITVDLRSAPGEVARVLADIRTEMQHAGPGMDPWPFRITAVRLPGDELSLHIVCSLLVADGWSVQLMFTELFTYLDDPNTVLPPLTAHFGDYVETINRQRLEPEWQIQRDWWWDRLDDLPTAPALPLAVPFDQVRPDTLARREFRVTGEQMAVLRTHCAAYNITPTTAFATCYALALAELAGHRRFLLNVLYLNRLHLPRDLDHAIGPYAGTVLLDVALPQEATFAAAAQHLQAAMATMLDHGQVTGVEVVRELSRRRRDTAPQAPVVFHSTLGLHPPGGTPDTVDVREFYQRVRTPQVALDMQVFQWDWDDSVAVNLDAVAELFPPGVLDDLFTAVCDQVTDLVRRPEAWTQALALPAAERPAGRIDAAVRVTADGPPATDTEKAIAELWAQLLDSAEIDRGTDFFSAGGDSVMAIRMLGRLRAEFGLALTPREFLADPTLAAVGHAVAESPRDCLVPLRDGTGRPLFLVHPTGGDVLCYLDLARALTTDGPVIGIQDPELTGAAGPQTIVGLAEVYERVVRERQPEGPYRLGGWSMGGIIAHELARRLRAAGETVEVLVLVDANIADRIHHVDGGAFWSRYLGSLEAFLDINLGTDSRGIDFDSLSESERRVEAEARLAAAGLAERGAPEDKRLRENIFRRHLRALGEHATGPLDGAGLEVLLIRAELPSPRNSGVGMGVDDCADLEALGWAAYTAAAIDSRPIAAHHYALLRPPAVGLVAHQISERLARVNGAAE
ncbi:acyltransferase domain-containing protein [Nocardia sp. NPDC046763]|uniref:acyltransferase domain-containing protein n=1 Tax=Nocardia sp. NPDC046763 TaxID=3155256 RepID=UPI0033C856D8